MKLKAILPFILICLIFSSCSMQEGVNPQIFIERYSDKMRDFLFDFENAFYDDDGYHCLFNSGNESFLVSLIFDGSSTVYEASVFGENKEISDDFKFAAVNLALSFSRDEGAEEILNCLIKKCENKPVYYESQWISYCLFKTENGVYFSVSDKKFHEYSVPEQTLKENDLAGRK